MATRGEFPGQFGPLVILVVLLASVIFYAITVQPTDREAVIGAIYYERYAFDATPGSIKGTPTGISQLAHDLGVVEIDFSPTETSQQLSEQLLIKRSALSDKPAIFYANLNAAELSGARLDFAVVSKVGDTELMVELNGVLVSSAVLRPGKHSIELPTDKLVQGSNKLKISVAPPGAAFWQSTSYALSDVTFTIEDYSSANAAAQQTFTLNQQELAGLVSAKLEAYVKQLSQKPATINLNLNGKTIYSAMPATSALALDLPPALLNSTNTLDWSVERGGKYELAFGKATTSYVKNPFKVKSWTFVVTREEAIRAKASSINCWLEAKGTADATLVFNMNSQAATTFKLTGGSLKEDICKYLKSGDNFLSVYSSSDVQLDELSLLIKGKI